VVSPLIVIFAREDDRHAVAVAGILERNHGKAVSIVNLSAFPALLRLGARFSPVERGGFFIDPQGRRTDFAAIESFWWRRPQALLPDPAITDAQAQQFAVQESLSALYGVLRCCPGLWVNDIEHDSNADYKPRQLAAMQRIGLPLPDTLITNDPDEARAFFDAHRGEVVYKAFNQRGLIWLPTRRLAADDLVHLDALRFAPVIFQQLIEGVRDIRVTVVGDQVFATEFAIENAGCIDHRLLLATAPCAAHRLPGAVERQALRLVRELGLEYGSIDLRMTAAGEYFFFELNTAGEFLYLEERTGQPIAAAVAAHLAAGRPAAPVDAGVPARRAERAMANV
jgi:RimK-like ATP-grasp domain